MSRHYRSYLKRWLGVLFSLALVGCGNEFRPVAIPIPGPPGTPQPQKQAVVISTTPNGGTATNINVSGTNLFAVRDVPSPVHAALTANSSRTFIANDNDTLSTYLTFGTLSFSPVLTITLPSGSKPVFVHSREASNVYVALNAPDPACGGGNGSVGVVSITTLTLIGTTCAGVQPVALAELPNGSKLYVANQGSNDVTVVNTADRSIATTIAVGSAPSAIDVSADGSFVYVANKGSGTVSVIDAIDDTIRATLTVGSMPTFLKYEDTNKKVYVVNSGSNSVSIIDANSASASFLGSPVSTLPVGNAPVSVTPLVNGAKAYVANSGSNSVTVINAQTQTVIGTVALGTSPVDIGSSPDSNQVFVAREGIPSPNPQAAPTPAKVSVIRTSDDTINVDIALPPAPGLLAGTVVITPKQLLVTP